MFGFSNHSTKLKYYDDSNKAVFGEMKDKLAVLYKSLLCDICINF